MGSVRCWSVSTQSGVGAVGDEIRVHWVPSMRIWPLVSIVGSVHYECRKQRVGVVDKIRWIK